MKIYLEDIALVDSMVIINALETLSNDSERHPIDRVIASKYANIIKQQAVEYIKNRGDLDAN